MEFSPFNKIVQLCVEGMQKEENAQTEEALERYQEAWKQASNDFEKFLAAYYLARQQESPDQQLETYQKSLEHALKSDSPAAKTALPSLYANMARCYEALGAPEEARKHAEQAEHFQKNPADKGPFYHGSRAELQVGDLLRPGTASNYQTDLRMRHIYFTASLPSAGLAAALAKGPGDERVYRVEPTGTYENDPNLTDKKFPGNPTRSYRSEQPLRILEVLKSWPRPAPEALEGFREKLAGNRGDIIN